ncbi:hypothetical protein [Trichoplusia ni single nucleopolyhedrovirus]|uniref:Uncharacterized protein n=1 Tax=Trichoplusia ni single nucleopolyhedrovirus TaxID=332054 RepID=Q461S4_9ABAC|nr:hypothetical protein TNSV_gp142 [Trichoplusia ni single nucleopolyhedrovirus]AAZ67512.1 hypothetical protein [Trichoplusia ni single nucleopolyhedrovirus]
MDGQNQPQNDDNRHKDNCLKLNKEKFGVDYEERDLQTKIYFNKMPTITDHKKLVKCRRKLNFDLI